MSCREDWLLTLQTLGPNKVFTFITPHNLVQPKLNSFTFYIWTSFRYIGSKKIAHKMNFTFAAKFSMNTGTIIIFENYERLDNQKVKFMQTI